MSGSLANEGVPNTKRQKTTDLVASASLYNENMAVSKSVFGQSKMNLAAGLDSNAGGGQRRSSQNSGNLVNLTDTKEKCKNFIKRVPLNNRALHLLPRRPASK